jgi:hypothetical protein
LLLAKKRSLDLANLLLKQLVLPLEVFNLIGRIAELVELDPMIFFNASQIIILSKWTQ